MYEIQQTYVTVQCRRLWHCPSIQPHKRSKGYIVQQKVILIQFVSTSAAIHNVGNHTTMNRTNGDVPLEIRFNRPGVEGGRYDSLVAVPPCQLKRDYHVTLSCSPQSVIQKANPGAYKFALGVERSGARFSSRWRVFERVKPEAANKMT